MSRMFYMLLQVIACQVCRTFGNSVIRWLNVIDKVYEDKACNDEYPAAYDDVYHSKGS